MFNKPQQRMVKSTIAADARLSSSGLTRWRVGRTVKRREDADEPEYKNFAPSQENAGSPVLLAARGRVCVSVDSDLLSLQPASLDATRDGL